MSEIKPSEVTKENPLRGVSRRLELKRKRKFNRENRHELKTEMDKVEKKSCYGKPKGCSREKRKWRNPRQGSEEMNMRRGAGVLDFFKKSWRKEAESLGTGFAMTWGHNFFNRLISRAEEFGSDKGEDSKAAECAYFIAGISGMQEELRKLSVSEMRDCQGNRRKMGSRSDKLAITRELAIVARLIGRDD